MLNSDNLKYLQNISIAKFPKSDLVDLRNVHIDTKKSVQDRMNEYFMQIKNPYLFRVDDVGVKVSFGSGKSFSESLGIAISRVANYQILSD